MYEEKEHRISWILLLKRILWYVLVVIVILGLIALITRCARNSKDTKTKTTIDLSNEVLKLQEASLQYFSINNLPQKENESRSVKLKYLIAKDYIKPLTDSKDNKCDTSESYSEVTRLENNYYLVTKVKCGKNSKTKKVYIGCFAECNGKICIGKKEDNGICEIKEEPETTTTTTTTTTKTTTRNTTKRTNSTKTTQRTQTRTLKTIKRTTTTTKSTTTSRRTTTTTKSTTTSRKTTTTTKPTTTSRKPTTTSRKTTATTQPTTPKPTNPPTTPKTCYKHRKYTCTEGTLSGSKCIVVEKKNTKKTQVGSPETIRSGTYSTPAACFGAPNGQIYECILDRVDWSSLEPFIYIKTVYSLCTSPYEYDSSIDKCVNTTTYDATPVYVWSYSSYVSGYTKIGPDAAWHCNN